MSWIRKYQVMLEAYDESGDVQVLLRVPQADNHRHMSGALRWIDDFGDRDLTYIIQSYYENH